MLRLRLERQRLAMSLAQLCQLTGVEPATLSKVERGLLPAYPGWRRRIAEAFGMPEEILFAEVPDDEHEREREASSQDA